MATRVQEALQEARRQGWTAVAGNKHWKLVPPNGLSAEYPRPLVLPHGSNQRDRGASWANFLRGVRDFGEAGQRLADTLDPPNGTPKRAPKAPSRPQWLDPEPQPVSTSPFSARVEQIGPAEATRMLGCLYERQRPRRDAEIQKWADEMRAGRWTVSNDAVTFDVEGRLINGQHRLYAVIRSGATVPFLVVRGLPPEAYESMDTGRKRRFGDLLRSEGEKDVTNQAGVTNRLICYATTGDLGALVNLTTPQLAKFYRAHAPAIREATATAHIRLYPKTRFSVSHMGALIFLWNAVDEAATKDFVDELRSGGGDPDEPSAQLREALIRRLATPVNRRPATVVYAALAAKAWNLFMRRDRVATLRWSRVENFPPIWDPEEVLPDLLAQGM